MVAGEYNNPNTDKNTSGVKKKIEKDKSNDVVVMEAHSTGVEERKQENVITGTQPADRLEEPPPKDKLPYSILKNFVAIGALPATVETTPVPKPSESNPQTLDSMLKAYMARKEKEASESPDHPGVVRRRKILPKAPEPPQKGSKAIEELEDALSLFSSTLCRRTSGTRPSESKDAGKVEKETLAQVEEDQTTLSSEPKEDQTTPSSEPKEDQTTPSSEPKEDQTTPSSEPKEDQTTPSSEPKEDQTTLSSEPKEDQTTLSSEPKEDQTTPSSEPKEDQTTLSSDPKEDQTTLSSEPKEDQTTPSSEPKDQTTLSSEPKEDQTTLNSEPKEDQTTPSSEPKEDQTTPSSVPKEDQTTLSSESKEDQTTLRSEPKEDQTTLSSDVLQPTLDDEFEDNSPTPNTEMVVASLHTSTNLFQTVEGSLSFSTEPLVGSPIPSEGRMLSSQGDYILRNSIPEVEGPSDVFENTSFSFESGEGNRRNFQLSPSNYPQSAKHNSSDTTTTHELPLEERSLDTWSSPLSSPASKDVDPTTQSVLEEAYLKRDSPKSTSPQKTRFMRLNSSLPEDQIPGAVALPDDQVVFNELNQNRNQAVVLSFKNPLSFEQDPEVYMSPSVMHCSDFLPPLEVDRKAGHLVREAPYSDEAEDPEIMALFDKEGSSSSSTPEPPRRRHNQEESAGDSSTEFTRKKQHPPANHVQPTGEEVRGARITHGGEVSGNTGSISEDDKKCKSIELGLPETSCSTCNIEDTESTVSGTAPKEAMEGENNRDLLRSPTVVSPPFSGGFTIRNEPLKFSPDIVVHSHQTNPPRDGSPHAEVASQSADGRIDDVDQQEHVPDNQTTRYGTPVPWVGQTSHDIGSYQPVIHVPQHRRHRSTDVLDHHDNASLKTDTKSLDNIFSSSSGVKEDRLSGYDKPSFLPSPGDRQVNTVHQSETDAVTIGSVQEDHLAKENQSLSEEVEKSIMEVVRSPTVEAGETQTLDDKPNFSTESPLDSQVQKPSLLVPGSDVTITIIPPSPLFFPEDHTTGDRQSTNSDVALETLPSPPLPVQEDHPVEENHPVVTVELSPSFTPTDHSTTTSQLNSAPEETEEVTVVFGVPQESQTSGQLSEEENVELHPTSTEELVESEEHLERVENDEGGLLKASVTMDTTPHPSESLQGDHSQEQEMAVDEKESCESPIIDVMILNDEDMMKEQRSPYSASAMLVLSPPTSPIQNDISTQNESVSEEVERSDNTVVHNAFVEDGSHEDKQENDRPGSEENGHDTLLNEPCVPFKESCIEEEKTANRQSKGFWGFEELEDDSDPKIPVEEEQVIQQENEDPLFNMEVMREFPKSPSSESVREFWGFHDDNRSMNATIKASHQHKSESNSKEKSEDSIQLAVGVKKYERLTSDMLVNEDFSFEELEAIVQQCSSEQTKPTVHSTTFSPSGNTATEKLPGGTTLEKSEKSDTVSPVSENRDFWGFDVNSGESRSRGDQEFLMQQDNSTPHADEEVNRTRNDSPTPSTREFWGLHGDSNDNKEDVSGPMIYVYFGNDANYGDGEGVSVEDVGGDEGKPISLKSPTHRDLVSKEQEMQKDKTSPSSSGQNTGKSPNPNTLHPLGRRASTEEIIDMLYPSSPNLEEESFFVKCQEGESKEFIVVDHSGKSDDFVQGSRESTHHTSDCDWRVKDPQQELKDVEKQRDVESGGVQPSPREDSRPTVFNQVEMHDYHGVRLPRYFVPLQGESQDGATSGKKQSSPPVCNPGDSPQDIGTVPLSLRLRRGWSEEEPYRHRNRSSTSSEGNGLEVNGSDRERGQGKQRRKHRSVGTDSSYAVNQQHKKKVNDDQSYMSSLPDVLDPKPRTGCSEGDDCVFTDSKTLPHARGRDFPYSQGGTLPYGIRFKDATTPSWSKLDATSQTSQNKIYHSTDTMLSGHYTSSREILDSDDGLIENIASKDRFWREGDQGFVGGILPDHLGDKEGDQVSITSQDLNTTTSLDYYNMAYEDIASSYVVLHVIVMDQDIRPFLVNPKRNVSDIIKDICLTFNIPSPSQWHFCMPKGLQVILQRVRHDSKTMLGGLDVTSGVSKKTQFILSSEIVSRDDTLDGTQPLEDQYSFNLKPYVIHMRRNDGKKRESIDGVFDDCDLGVEWPDKEVDAKKRCFFQSWCRVVKGDLPVERPIAAEIAALLLQAKFGDYDEKTKRGKECIPTFLPEAYKSSKGTAKQVLRIYKRFNGITQERAMSAVITRCREQPAYDGLFFNVKVVEERGILKISKLKSGIFGICSREMVYLEPKTAKVIFKRDYSEVKSVEASKRHFKIDFGAHHPDPFAAASPVAFEIMNILKLCIQMQSLPPEFPDDGHSYTEVSLGNVPIMDEHQVELVNIV